MGVGNTRVMLVTFVLIRGCLYESWDGTINKMKRVQSFLYKFVLRFI